MRAAPDIGFDLVTTTFPLSRIKEAWSANDTGKRIVIVPE
jgi:predicted adenine nucleotide alpha hydrolase (AANH) superfamily ATPase